MVGIGRNEVLGGSRVEGRVEGRGVGGGSNVNVRVRAGPDRHRGDVR